MLASITKHPTSGNVSCMLLGMSKSASLVPKTDTVLIKRMSKTAASGTLYA